MSKMGKEIKTRLDWIDQARGVLFIFVMLIHSKTSPSFLTPLYLPFFLTGFFFLSGYLYKDKSLKEKLLSVFNGLFMPFLLYCFVWGGIILFVTKSINESFKMLCFNLYGGDYVWFIPCLILVEILYTILRYYIKEKVNAVVIAISFISMPLTCHFGLSRGFWTWEVALFAIGFFALGNTFKNKLLDKYKSIILGIVYILLCFWFGEKGFLDGVDIHLNKYSNPILFLILSIIGSTVFISIMKFVPTNKFIVEFGRYTLFLFPFHMIIVSRCIKLIKTFGVSNDYLLCIATIVIAFFVCLYISRYIYRYMPALGGKKKWIGK